MMSTEAKLALRPFEKIATIEYHGTQSGDFIQFTEYSRNSLIGRNARITASEAALDASASGIDKVAVN
ncbi:hypothetical protein [Methylobacterium sp. 275MFSha3.1]|uniref:hypothetical protein n=1 Tax=Methylobacterium sp. 275MFSha3.1 TaxID=1502746 RepID=UPI0011154810|nr:hypothetical protein [Methylobacterium sp. 275MFSha3.1]